MSGNTQHVSLSVNSDHKLRPCGKATSAIFFLFLKLSSVSKPIQSNWVAKWISITRPFHFNWALRRTQSVFCSKKGLGIWQIWQIVSIFPFVYSSVPEILDFESWTVFFQNFEKVNQMCVEDHIFAFLSIFFFPDPHLLWWLMLLIWRLHVCWIFQIL